MSDIGSETTERGEFHLTRLRLHVCQVFQKYHRADVATATYRHETRSDFVVKHLGGRRIETGDRIFAPLPEASRQFRRIVLEVRLAATAMQRAQHLLGARIVLADH